MFLFSLQGGQRRGWSHDAVLRSPSCLEVNWSLTWSPGLCWCRVVFKSPQEIWLWLRSRLWLGQFCSPCWLNAWWCRRHASSRAHGKRWVCESSEHRIFFCVFRESAICYKSFFFCLYAMAFLVTLHKALLGGVCGLKLSSGEILLSLLWIFRDP